MLLPSFYKSSILQYFQLLVNHPGHLLVHLAICPNWHSNATPFPTEGGCGDPGTAENGRKVGVIYFVNSKVYFDCDLGYGRN